MKCFFNLIFLNTFAELTVEVVNKIFLTLSTFSNFFIKGTTLNNSPILAACTQIIFELFFYLCKYKIFPKTF